MYSQKWSNANNKAVLSHFYRKYPRFFQVEEEGSSQSGVVQIFFSKIGNLGFHFLDDASLAVANHKNASDSWLIGSCQSEKCEWFIYPLVITFHKNYIKSNYQWTNESLAFFVLAITN